MRVSIAFQLACITVERMLDITGYLVDGEEMHLEINTLKRLAKEIAGDMHLQAINVAKSRCG